MATILLTGFPGYLASSLLPRLLDRPGEPQVLCLVQERYLALAKERWLAIAHQRGIDSGRVRLVTGDLTQDDLGVTDLEATVGAVTEIFHLAAIYDLAVPREAALAVNLRGTVHILRAAALCSQLDRFQYVSTCYVAGKHRGPFREDDLELGQGFHNFYEESKFLAEIEVRKAAAEGLPVTIYRPAIVVGDSRTGATQKFDGPYFILRWLLRQPGLAFLPVPAGVETTPVNVVPSDFVIDAIAGLSADPSSRGRTFHLADPAPPTVDEALRAFADVTCRVVVRLPASISTSRFLLERVPGLRRLTGIPPQAVDYFAYGASFDTTATTRALEPLGIRCPPFLEYLPRLVAFLRAHPELPSAGLS